MLNWKGAASVSDFCQQSNSEFAIVARNANFY
jgi:hypothetical protein